MNVLITNTRNVQSYSIIRALRPYAKKIVVTMYGANRLVARLSHAANSHLVDKRYYVPSPVADWRVGNIRPENTEREEAYIQAVLKICEAEKIDTIYPSWDPHVYVFSKNKARFEKLGILIPIPDYETIVTPLDKYRTVQAAQEVGFPCPRTYLPESQDDLQWIAKELGFPLVLKPRFSSAGRGIEMVKDYPTLLERIPMVQQHHGMPMLQEFVPGKETFSFYIVIDKQGELKSTVGHKKVRVFFRRTANHPTVQESLGPHPYLPQAIRLVQQVGWWGSLTVQTKIDARDGIPKLMELNPRLGLGLWTRTELGINEPWMCINIARGDPFEVKRCPVGVLLIDPVADMLGLGLHIVDLLFYTFRTKVQGKVPDDPSNPPMALKELILSYWQTYFGGKQKVFNPYFRYFFQDPLVSILSWLQFCALISQTVRPKHLGR